MFGGADQQITCSGVVKSSHGSHKFKLQWLAVFLRFNKGVVRGAEDVGLRGEIPSPGLTPSRLRILPRTGTRILRTTFWPASYGLALRV